MAATKPTHVAVGDPDTASGQDNLMDWVGTPVQMTAWGPGFLSTPPAGAQMIRMRGAASVTTSASGVATVTLPTAFPNGLAWWSAVTASGNLFTIRSAVTGANTSTIVFVCSNAAGAAVASTAVSFIWEAEGW